MFYPIGGCETQPLITLADITLRNIESHGNLLTPGVIRANETNPGTGFVFENVRQTSWWTSIRANYITENIYGETSGSYPIPFFLNDGDSETHDSSLFGLAFQVNNSILYHAKELFMEVVQLVMD